MSDIYCFTDGSRGETVSGIGYVLSGAVEAEGARILDGEFTSMEVELHALLEAVRVATIRSSSRESITIYTDCEPLVRKLRDAQTNGARWERYRESALWLLGKFDSWDIRHTDRDMVEDAHDLARAALERGRNS